ncbi:S-methyl-5-thioribose-1-phosphate isomerase [candidate division WOR-3 bacterium]|nr:S-methyl-5-thioribose-1-phosphate isomerase [candidate division WOR-3 bacterium]
MQLNFSTIEWRDGKIRILDQTLLPEKVIYKDIDTVQEIAEAINVLRVRGAPLIGAVAGYGVALSAQKAKNTKEIKDAITLLEQTRPTAYNLFSALNRMKKIVGAIHELPLLILQEAHRIKKEDKLLCEQIGKNGASLIPERAQILTHCNAGALATCGIGTALAPIYITKGRIKRVFVPETRPVLQGARLTAWELQQAKIPVTLICDSARGVVIKEVNLCIVGADRIARNGDTANKIGTYTLAILAKAHNVPFYVAAPSTTFDLSIESGEQIPIEFRNPDEVRKIGDCEIAPKDIDVFNPAFDVTPNEYITGFITENGIQTPPFQK